VAEAELEDVVEDTAHVVEEWEETILTENMISLQHLIQAQAEADLIQIHHQALVVQEFA
jgi:hypothetical protein